jgi:predicted RNA binding protein YcfA (HicA-like mRNA interferase family)
MRNSAHRQRIMAVAKVRDILKMLRRDGWWLDRQAGSHRQFRHAVKKGTVTVNGHDAETLPHWLVGGILRQAGLTKEDLAK